MKHNSYFLLITIAALSFPVYCQAKATLESDDILLAARSAHELAKQYGVENVLVVFDLDNTLLTANQDIGGDAWFNWQADLISKGDFSQTVGKTVSELIQAQVQLFSLGHMHTVQPETEQVFTGLQKEGFTTLILTSRGLESRDATKRELVQNHLFTDLKPLGGDGIAGAFIPYDPSNAGQACLTEEDVKKLKLGKARPVILDEGLFMTSGQNKGAMLRTLLCKLHKSVSAIVFTDDTLKHVERMHDAYDARNEDLVTIRYSHEDKNVQKFFASDKTEVVGAWAKFSAMLQEIFK